MADKVDQKGGGINAQRGASDNKEVAIADGICRFCENAFGKGFTV